MIPILFQSQKRGLFRNPPGYLDYIIRVIAVDDPRVAVGIEGDGIVPPDIAVPVNGHNPHNVNQFSPNTLHFFIIDPNDSLMRSLRMSAKNHLGQVRKKEDL
jgi:hypothetical protein